jgi:hypothetical protein
MQGKHKTRLINLRRLLVERRPGRPAGGQAGGVFGEVASLAGAGAPAHPHPAGEAGCARLRHHRCGYPLHQFHIDLRLVHRSALPLRRPAARPVPDGRTPSFTRPVRPVVDPAVVLRMAKAMLFNRPGR